MNDIDIKFFTGEAEKSGEREPVEGDAGDDGGRKKERGQHL